MCAKRRDPPGAPCSRGGEIVLQRSRGGFIAEASLDAKPTIAMVAATDGRLLQFPRSAFQAALENDRAFNRAWIRLLGWEVRRVRAKASGSA